MDRSQSRKVALVWRGDARARASGGEGRFAAVFAALRDAGFAPEACYYDESFAQAVRAQLLACDAVLVWVNPIQDGVRRHGLDALLREAAAAGVKVSAHPDVLAKMGVKAVLWRTRDIGWSGDARLYAEPQAFRDGFPAGLAAGPRVLKQNRGNGGIGVWKVETVADGVVQVREAASDASAVLQPLPDFMAARLAAFAEADGYVDQAYQPRLPEGMVRCYMAGAEVAGFGHHLVRALAPPDAGPGGPRLYSGPDDPRFQRLRALMQDVWTPRLAEILGLGPADLPAIWDADFLLGPPDDAGEDSYVLCEINASCVSPMPDTAPAAIARTLAARFP
jgi:hypothetical protein